MAICKKCGKVMNKGMYLHEKNCKGKIESGDIESHDETHDETHMKSPEIGQNKKVMEVNLMSEFKNNQEKISPKKSEEISSNEPNYKCGQCNEEFYWKNKPKFCPICGVEF